MWQILEGRCQDAMPDMSAEARRGLRSLPPYRDSERAELVKEGAGADMRRRSRCGVEQV